MDHQNEPLETLREIRSLMERSSRSLSLSGLSGVVAGFAALSGMAAFHLYGNFQTGLILPLNGRQTAQSGWDFYKLLMMDMLIVLVVSLLAAGWLSMRRARKENLPVWDTTARRLLINLGIPLLAGGLYCLILIYHGLYAFIAPATILFYGLALLHASKYTWNEIRQLGLLQIAIGLLANLFVEYSLLFWALGFGILHIAYGISMYLKNER